MTTRTRAQMMHALAAIAAIICLAGLHQPALFAGRQGAALTETIPVDPLITVGTLPNGLRYYIRANAQPRNRAELRLVVNAGSLLEDEDQRGLAHFVEHMCFNGTSHFPGQDIGAFMQSIGMRVGAHVNAHTSFDETVYQLQIPTDNPALLERALLIMEDWAHNVSFEPAEIDKERGVILEEWRLGLGAEARMRDAQFPILLKGSRYADRLPIGKPEILRTFPHDRLKQFYKDWYRPDLMAVIAVGDFSKPAIEARIKAHFGSSPAVLSAKPRPTFDVPDHAGTLYAIATDPEATSTSVGVYTKIPFRDPTTAGAYRQQMMEGLFSGMLSQRFQELAQKPDPPFLAAETTRGLFVRSKEATILNALVTDDGIERGLAALFTEADRVARFGFTPTEFDRQRLNIQRNLERAVGEKDQHPSASLADEYIRNFMQQEPIPGIVYEYGLYQRFLPQISLAEINALARDWAPDRNRVVLVNAPRKPGPVVPDERRLAAVIKAATGGPMIAYVDSLDARPLLDPLPTPGAITKTSTREAFGITEWTLSNGVRVVLKPTTFKPDEILVRAVSPGGTSLASDADFIAAETAAQVVSQSGIGKLTEIDLSKTLAGKSVFIRPEIDDTDQGLAGQSSRKDLETLFQLIHLTFTEPRADPSTFEILKGQLKATLANRSALPEAQFSDALTAALSQNHPRARPMTPALVDQMNLDKSLAFYKQRFADASGFTFVFVGSFDVPAMKPLVERYLGSLPASHTNEIWKDVGIRPPPGVVEKRIEKGIDPKSQVGIVFTGPFQFDPMHRLALRALAETLEGNLHSSLREDLGGTYNVNVAPSFERFPTESYRLALTFSCNPERTDDLIKNAFQQIEQFKANGPSRGQIADARAALERDFETNSRQNGYVLSQLLFSYQYGEDLGNVFNMQTFFDRLTPSMIQDAARQYLNTDRYVKVTLFPEKK
jgi:zinc protease